MARLFVAASSQTLNVTATPLITAYPFSVSLLFKPTSAVAGTLISATDATGGYWSMTTEADGSVSLELDADGSGATALPNSGATVLSNGTTYRLTAVFTNATDRSLYVNTDVFTDTTSEAYPAGLDDLSIGSLGTTLDGARSSYADGEIADVGIWDVALTAAEVAALSAGYSADTVRPAKLVNYWPLVGFADPEIDVYGKQDLTVTGATKADHPRLLRIKRKAAFFSTIHRTAYTRYLDGYYDIDAFAPTVKYLDGYYDLNAYEAARRYVDGYYDLNAFAIATRKLDGYYDLNAFTPLVRYLDAAYDIAAFQQATRYLDAAYDLNAFAETTRFLDAQYDINVFTPVVRYLDGQYDINVLTATTRFLDATYDLNAYELATRFLDAQYDIATFTPTVRYLDATYDLQTLASVTRYLDGQYDLQAFEESVRYLDATYDLAVYEQVTRYLDAVYDLLANEVFYGYAINLDTNTVTKYENFNFNSLGPRYGAKSDGIYRFGGTNDNGARIDWSVKTGKLAFGPAQTRVTDAYLNTDTDGDLTFTMTADSGTTAYTAKETNTMKKRKLNLAQGHNGQYWQFEVKNKANTTATGELNEVELIVQKTSRRI
jgi:hypothetical protein